MSDLAADIVATMRQPVLVLDGGLCVQLTNPSFCEAFQVSDRETLGKRLYDLGNGQWDIPELRSLLNRVLDGHPEVHGYRVEHAFEGIGQRIMLLNARQIRRDAGPDRILLAIEDVTQVEDLRWKLDAQRELAEKVIDASRESLLVLGLDLRVKSANETFYQTFKVCREQTEGRMVYDLGNGQWNIPRLRELLEQVLPDNDSFDDFEVEHDFDDVGHRVMLLNARWIDHMQLILLAIEDITERQRTERALRQSEERMRQVIDNDVVGLAFFDRAGRLIGANSGFRTMTGYSREEIESGALTWRSLTPPEWIADSEAQLRKLARTGRNGPYEKQYYVKDGRRAWMLFAGRSLDNGVVAEFCIDIEDRKKAEEHRQLLIAELNHRVKNTLAIVQAVALQTFRGSDVDQRARRAFEGRLRALAEAHNLLTRSHWEKASLREVVTGAAEACGAGEQRFLLEGEDIELPARAAVPIAMALHELCTNAIKYGSLSTEEGRVLLQWEIANGPTSRLAISWREEGGPPVTPPTTRGFGSMMVEQALSHELDGEVTMDFRPDGLFCRIEAPLPRVEAA